MKTIGIVITRLIPGGATQIVKQIISYGKDKYKFILFTGKEDFSEFEHSQINDYCSLVIIPKLVRNISLLKDFAAYNNLIKEFKVVKPDIVHTHTSKAGILGRMAAKKAGISNIIHSPHGCIYLSESNIDGVPAFSPALKILQFAERMAGKSTSFLTVLSEHEKQINTNLNLFNKNEIVVIPNGIELSKFYVSHLERTNARKDLQIEKTINIISVGRLSPEKGHVLIFNAFENICSNYKDINCKILIVGDGPEMDHLKIKAKELEELFHIKTLFLGHKTDIKKYLAAGDIFVLPSFYEGFGLAAIEAMSTGLPVIASNVGGLPEVIDNEKNGLLFKSGDFEDLANKLLILINSKPTREKLSEQAFQKSKNFNIDIMLNKYYKLYNNN